MKLEFSRQIFEKSTNIKFHQNQSIGSRVVSCGKTDGHESNSRFSQSCRRSNVGFLYRLKLSIGMLVPFLKSSLIFDMSFMKTLCDGVYSCILLE